MFGIADLTNRHKAYKIEIEKSKIYKSMLGSTRHILNNFLQKTLILKIYIEKTPEFSSEVLEAYDSMVEEAVKQIKALGEIDNIDEINILESVLPKLKKLSE